MTPGGPAEALDSRRPKVTVSGLCRRAGMSRQALYKERRQRRRREVDESAILDLVRRERHLQPRLGGRKLLRLLRGDLKRMGISIGRDRFFDLLRRHGLLIEPPRRSCRTTYSAHGFATFGNLLKGAAIDGPHQAWVSDITYIRTDEGFAYLSLISDLHSRQIVGWEVSPSLCAEGPLRALEMALRQLPAGAAPIHHSDRGIQYCCQAYVESLQRRGVSISMTEDNHCYENAQAERLNGIMKQEYGLGGTFRRRHEVRPAVAQGVMLYNTRRPHTSLDYRTPSQAHQAA